MSEVTTQNNTKTLVPLYYFQAMQMRFEGYRYSEIAEKLQLSEDHIRHLFYKNGVLHELYNQYVAEEIEFRKKHARETFAAHVEDVARRFVTIVNKGKEMTAILAGKEILDRVEGKVGSKVGIEHSGTVGIAMVDVLRLIKEAKDEQRTNQNNNPGAG